MQSKAMQISTEKSDLILYLSSKQTKLSFIAKFGELQVFVSMQFLKKIFNLLFHFDWIFVLFDFQCSPSKNEIRKKVIEKKYYMHHHFAINKFWFDFQNFSYSFIMNINIIGSSFWEQISIIEALWSENFCFSIFAMVQDQANSSISSLCSGYFCSEASIKLSVPVLLSFFYAPTLLAVP